MNNSKVIIVFILAFLFLSCKEKKDNEVIYSEFVNFDSLHNGNKRLKLDYIVFNKNLSVFFGYNKDENLIRIRVTLNKRQYGPYFKFDASGTFERYYYMLGDSLHNSLQIEKDSLLNKYIEKGNQFVDYMANTDDSSIKKYSLMFSEFPRKKLDVSLSLNGLEYNKIGLHNSKLIPLVKEANVNVQKYTKIIFLKIVASEPYFKINGIKDSIIFYDTLKFN